MTSKHPAAEKKLNKIYKYLTKYASIERQKIGELNPEMTDLELEILLNRYNAHTTADERADILSGRSVALTWFPGEWRCVKEVQVDGNDLIAVVWAVNVVEHIDGEEDGRYIHDLETDNYLIAYEERTKEEYNENCAVAIDLESGTIGYFENGERPLSSDFVGDDIHPHYNKYTPVKVLGTRELGEIANVIYMPHRYDGLDANRRITRVFNGIKHRDAKTFNFRVKYLLKQAKEATENAPVKTTTIDMSPFYKGWKPWQQRTKAEYAVDVPENAIKKYKDIDLPSKNSDDKEGD